MNEKINITKSDGSAVLADIICFLENNTGAKYVYYTLNEIVGAGANSTVKIYVAKVKQDNPAIDVPISDAEWDKLKSYMSDALKNNANPEVKYVALSELNNPVSVGERAIAMPTSYDYINKQRGIYAQSVASTVASTPEVEAPQAIEAQPEVSTDTTPVANVVEPTPVVTEVPNVFDTPQPEAPVSNISNENVVAEAPTIDQETDSDSESEDTGSALTLTPINIDDIEKKYSEMIETINKLKEQELEAAKRYNATLELSAMHNEQHANYVQSEQSKEVSSEITSAPEVDVSQTAEVQPQVMPTSQPQETPVSDVNMETNWFDMPSN